MRFVAFVCLSFVAFGVAVAEEPAHRLTRPIRPILSEPEACPGANCSEPQRIRHLLEAATHMAAAGKHDHAAQLRTEAEAARERLLAAKLAELANLQAEIEQLRGDLPAPAQICLEFRLVSLSSRRLSEADVELADMKETVLNRALRGELLQTGVERPQPGLWFEVVAEDDADLAVLNRLCEQSLATILAIPKLTTVSGHTAQFQIGQELPHVRPGSLAGPRAPVESAPKYIAQPADGNTARPSRSVQIECLPLQLARGAIRLRLLCRLSRQAPQGESRVREFETVTELQPGQSFVVSGPAFQGDLISRPAQNPDAGQTRAENDETEFLILVKTSLIEPALSLTEHSDDGDRLAERVRYDSPAAPSSRRTSRSPRPFRVPSYQTPIRR